MRKHGGYSGYVREEEQMGCSGVTSLKIRVGQNDLGED
jgi:hypothetical protein